MFTGLIERIGTVRALVPESDAIYRILLHVPGFSGELANGESVAVSGACLTVADVSGEVFAAQMMPETMRTTRLGSLKSGDRVNLERALQVGSRLDGHIVQGHVDEVGRVVAIENQGSSSDTKKYWISMTKDIAWGVAAKGSVALDGVSLTVIDSQTDRFSVGLIPTTLRETTIGTLKVGDPVNVEIDVMARYIAQMLSFRTQPGKGDDGSLLSWEKLYEYGWA